MTTNYCTKSPNAERREACAQTRRDGVKSNSPARVVFHVPPEISLGVSDSLQGRLSLDGSRLHVEAIKKEEKTRAAVSGRRQFSRSVSLKIPAYPRQHMILFAAAGRACLLLGDTHACLLITTGTSGSDDDYQL